MTMIVTAYDNPADEYKTIFKAMTDIIFVKKNMRPQFWSVTIYAKKSVNRDNSELATK